jgi:septal ring factor EnvC (AmiA/AmiB activator)
MFAPDVEARFKRIEDAQAVAAELLRRFEIKTDERVGRLEVIQDAMAHWQDRIAEHQREMAEHQREMAEHQREMAEHQGEHEMNMANLDSKIAALVDAQMRGEIETNKLKDIVAELSRTVDRFLKYRSNGGTD